MNRPVGRSDEPVEFAPIPGLEAEWAGSTYVERSALWKWLGVVPVGFTLVFFLLLMGFC